MSQENERVLGWEDEIQDSGPDFTLLPAGDYNFKVESFERRRHNGSAKLPACPMAYLTLKVDGGDLGVATVFHRLYLHSTTEGFLSNFFEGIGQKQEGQKIQMNWNAVISAKGRCKLEINRYTSNGEERENNQVDRFLPFEEYQKNSGGQAQTQQQAPAQQQQQPFPTQQQQPNQQQNQQGGFTPGQF